jgi:hypothetical protein
MSSKIIFASVFVILTALQCDEQSQTIHVKERINGLSFVAPPQALGPKAMPDVVAVHAAWLAVIPYGFTRIGEAQVHYNTNGQWWGERPDGVRATIDSAHNHGLKVMLKPQIYIPQGWTGDLDFESDSDWLSWEKSYEDYMMLFVDIATEKRAEMVCIGTELKKSIAKRPEFWRGLITKIRQKYNGKLTYAANWDDYESVPFWAELDFVGVNAYFPLTDSHTPSVPTLQKSWKPIVKKLRKIATHTQKPILFTEFGYMSVEGCAGKTWELEKIRRSLSPNPQAQANAYEALFLTFTREPYWAGGFAWKWYPSAFGREGHNDRDYTPQNKTAQSVLSRWYEK